MPQLDLSECFFFIITPVFIQCNGLILFINISTKVFFMYRIFNKLPERALEVRIGAHLKLSGLTVVVRAATTAQFLFLNLPMNVIIVLHKLR